MAKIKFDIIAAATRNLRIILVLANINKQYNILWWVNLINTIGGCCLFGYSFYHFRSSSDDLAGMAYNCGLLIGVFIGDVSGHVGKINLFKIVDDSYYSYDYQSSIMITKQNELEKPRAKALNGLFKTLVCLTCCAQINLIMVTAIVGIIKKKAIYIFPCWHPFDINNILSQIGILIWQESIILSITISAFGLWAMLYISYSHMRTEITLLQFALENIESRAREMMKNQQSHQKGEDDDKILSSCYKQCTRMCAEHHSDIISYFYNGKNYIGIFYSVAFMCGGTACTFGGCFISSDNIELQFKYLAMTSFILCYLYILFWIAEAISGKFLTIAETIYTLEWYKLPKECQSILRLMQLRSNHPLFYTLALGQKVDMEAYMALVRATYYYLNIIIS